MKKILLFLFGMVILGCSKEVKNTFLPPSLIANDRLVFENFDEFYKTYLTLAKNYSGDELVYQAQCKNHSTLLNSSDTTLNVYSTVFRTILNKNSEFEHGNLGSEKLVWLTGLDGEVYEGQYVFWDLTLTGTIYQYVIGDFQSHAWWNGPSLWE